MCVILNKEKHHLEGLNYRKLTEKVMYTLQNGKKVVSLSTARWRDQLALPHLCNTPGMFFHSKIAINDRTDGHTKYQMEGM